MIKNMRRKLSDLGAFTFTPSQSTIKVEGEDGVDLEEAVDRLSRVFGIAGFSRALKLEKDFELVLQQTGKYLEDQLLCASTFKVCAKRSDKKFPYDSPKICLLLGERLLDEYPHLTVDVHNPEITVTVEVRDNDIFVHANQLKGAGGMPVGSAGRAALMVSGGIDSPVAGWMMAKRGIELTAIHFASPPYTSERAEQKVHDLLRKVARYSGRIELSVVPFTEFQEAIRDKCPEDLFTIIMRRMMVLCAQQIASHTGCGALITGESLGQVASQTLGAIACTDEAATMPVFRPLIGMDKDEIISISRKIDTFEISILPFEDCCTVFTPRHPRTRPKLSDVIEAESKLDVDALVERAVAGVRKIVIN
jgi:thiamine biosynthesis protein ThiI